MVAGGEGGIRTLGTPYGVQRFSRPPRSTAPAPLRGGVYRTYDVFRKSPSPLCSEQDYLSGFQDRRTRPTWKRKRGQPRRRPACTVSAPTYIPSRTTSFIRSNLAILTRWCIPTGQLSQFTTTSEQVTRSTGHAAIPMSMTRPETQGIAVRINLRVTAVPVLFLARRLNSAAVMRW
jgi:hypothetical protein